MSRHDRGIGRREFAFAMGAAGCLAARCAGAAVSRPSTAIVVDISQPRVLAAENAREPIRPASLAKLMTMHIAYCAIQGGLIRPDDMLGVSGRAASMPHTSLGLAAGSSISLQDALAAMAVHSCNDVAVAVAERLAGTEDEFARLMTARAMALGMSTTSFNNASGLPDPGNLSTVLDLALLGGHIVMSQPGLWQYLGIVDWTYGGRVYRNSNKLLGVLPGVDGGKTGYVAESGHNLLASAVRGGRRVLVVVTGAETAAAAADRCGGYFERAYGS